MRSTRERPVVVGYDGSYDGRTALGWALREARRLKAPLRVVRAWQWDDELATLLTRMTPERMETVGHVKTLNTLGDVCPDCLASEVEVVVSGDEPGRAILTNSAEAQITVVGRHHLSLLERAFMGSVSDFVLQHTVCPVVIVPTGVEAVRPQPCVVVGVDGSRESRYALRFAAGEASRRSASLLVVAAKPTGMVAHLARDTSTASAERVESAQEFLDEAAVEIRQIAGFESLTVETRVQPEPAGEALVDAATSSEMLVVGSHGRGWLGRLALGSVSRYCVQHSTVPVAVVPEPVTRGSMGTAQRMIMTGHVP